MKESSHIIDSSNISFGTSGARGLVTDFTPEVCAAFAIAFANVIREQDVLTTMALAIDNRPSSYQMAQAISAGLAQIDIDTKFYGVIPTPALAYYAMQQNMPCVMVTGSHIPFDRNGLKFYKAQGEISKADETAILTAQAKVSPITSLPDLTVLPAAKDAYILRNTEAFSSDSLKGKRIGIYEHSSAGRDIYNLIFEALGAEVISLGRSDEFVPIDTEAVAEEDKAKARAWVKEYKLDALFSTDGDGDRPLLSDEFGEWLRGDVLGLLCSKILGIEALSTPVSCNTAIEKSNLFKHIERTKIGSPYVISEFDSLLSTFNSVAGFEANGGYLLASKIKINGKIIQPLPTRDAILPAITLLSQLNQQSISEQVKLLPQRYTASDRIKDFARDKSLSLIANINKEPEAWLLKLDLPFKLAKVNDTDGFRMTFTDGEVVHLRPSGNAPELRCYAESNSQIKAEQLVKATLSAIQNL
ncbi:phosphomannomutase [Pseudoalteromonas spongiae]|uniref:Phosphomannomutase n=1 Tax=Pseudoalteromonas spongiae TaxID=298657 RepID=A0ABU8ENB6_9GAMM